MKTKGNTHLVAMVSMLSIVSLIGIVMIFFGVKDSFQLNHETRGYQVTTGYLSNYKMESDAEYDPVKHESSAATYVLIYSYEVNGQAFTVATDYSTSILPAIGSDTKIRYHPDDPGEAVIAGPNRNTVLLFVGAMFLVVPLFFLSVILIPNQKGKKHSIEIPKLIIGLLLVLFGYGALYMITGALTLTEIIRFYKTSFTLPLFIPPILIAAGLLACFQSVFPSNKKDHPKRKQDK